ncbi:MAG: isoaspartyl peptidase/L-asparaginase [Actinomycetota bacterium]|nr:isoaspartyl peptidase/L-asparaginase [Actinomycetota bacterium]
MTRPVVVVHAGAGNFSRDLHEREASRRAALESALESAAAEVEAGRGAVHAVRVAVMVMESFALFNAGYGSALCADGTVEMSAALMRGSDRAAGAVAAITRTEHPIMAAHSLLDAPEVLMVGAAADAHAAACGAAQMDPSSFITERQRARLAEQKTGASLTDPASAPAAADHGTVGAVCRDGDGSLAAATSTGGIRGQPPGRVGDTPLIGAGTWADRRVAVSCTGDGEAFIRAGAARLLAAMVEQGIALPDAARAVLDEVGRVGGRGGLIAVDAAGEVVMPRSSEVMPCGIWRPGEPLTSYA